jgi:uncharacterized protein YcnI
MRQRTLALALGGALLLAAPAAAGAHVTINPDTAPAGGFLEELVRVPNEMETGNTTKIDLKLPPGFAEASYESKPGWSVQVKKTKLAKPIQTDDGPVTEQVSEIIWTGDGKQGKIAPGQFADFPLSVQVPDKAGTDLVFKALQYYDNGKVVRWIGPKSADEPAPTVTVTKAEPGGAATSHSEPTAGKADHAKGAAAASTTRSSSGASKGLGIAALVIAILGLLAGLVALASARRRRATSGSGAQRPASGAAS